MVIISESSHGGREVHINDATSGNCEFSVRHVLQGARSVFIAGRYLQSRDDITRKHFPEIKLMSWRTALPQPHLPRLLPYASALLDTRPTTEAQANADVDFSYHYRDILVGENSDWALRCVEVQANCLNLSYTMRNDNRYSGTIHINHLPLELLFELHDEPDEENPSQMRQLRPEQTLDQIIAELPEIPSGAMGVYAVRATQMWQEQNHHVANVMVFDDGKHIHLCSGPVVSHLAYRNTHYTDWWERMLEIYRSPDGGCGATRRYRQSTQFTQEEVKNYLTCDTLCNCFYL